MALSFNTSGVVSELYVSDGQSVRAGDVLARLDPMEKKLALESAGIALEKAEIDSMTYLQVRVTGLRIPCRCLPMCLRWQRCVQDTGLP